MSHTYGNKYNPNSVSNQGEFHAERAGSKPMETHGHQIGHDPSPTAHIPTFHAETLPPGSAPASETYQPNPDLNNQGMYQSAATTMTGADSSDVHRGIGHPGQGMSSNELRHDGQHGNKKQPVGNVGRGGTAFTGPNPVDPRDPEFAEQRALDKDVPTGRHLRQ